MKRAVHGDVDLDSDSTGPIDHAGHEENIEDTAPGRLAAVTLPTDPTRKTTALDVTLIDAPLATTKLRFTGDASLFRLGSLNGR